jgi:hypothetical protein
MNAIVSTASWEMNWRSVLTMNRLVNSKTYSVISEDWELEMEVECGMLKKWGNKATKWIKKRIYNLFKKCVNLDKMQTMDDCAYTVAKFKRKLEKIHITGNIDEMLDKFDEQLPKDPRISDFLTFKNKIKFYCRDKHAKPPETNSHFLFEVDCRKPEYHGELDHIPTRALFGGVMMACGTLIACIPIPGCATVGGTIATTGFGMIVDGYVKKWKMKREIIHLI